MNTQTKQVAAVVLAILLTLSMAMGVSAAVATYEEVSITVKTAIVYEKASDKSTQLITLEKGFKFVPTGHTKSYWKMEFKKKNDDTMYTGYVKKSSVSTSDSAKTSASANTANPRTTSSTSPGSATAQSSNSSYQGILDGYSQKLKAAVPGLVAEYNSEAAKHSGDITALAKLSNAKMGKLADISNDGMGKMAEIMHKTGDSYSVYEKWAGKLTDVYMTEAGKITDAYMQSATR